MKLIDILRPPKLMLVRSPPQAAAPRTVQTPSGPATVFSSNFQTAWLSELGIAPRSIVEIGSYDGGDAIRFRETFPEARVLTIEADPERFRIAARNCEGRSIELIEAAILDKDGPVEWHQATVGGQVDAQGSLYQHTERLNRRYPYVKQALHRSAVSGRRLDTLCAELGIARIDLLHMDIQGAEYVALKGLGDLRPTSIFLELMREGWIGAGSIGDTRKLLKNLGYRLAAKLRHDSLYVAAVI